jgi:hypothetical protein
MKVRDLIDILSRLPDDLDVFVQGYEAGWTPLTDVTQERVWKNKYNSKWDGPHVLLGDAYTEEDAADAAAVVIDAVCIYR